MKNYNPNYKGKPRKKGMSQRWLGTVLLNAEANFRAVNGAEYIPAVLAAIDRLQTTLIDNKNSIDNKKTRAA